MMFRLPFNAFTYISIFVFDVTWPLVKLCFSTVFLLWGLFCNYKMWLRKKMTFVFFVSNRLVVSKSHWFGLVYYFLCALLPPPPHNATSIHTIQLMMCHTLPPFFQCRRIWSMLTLMNGWKWRVIQQPWGLLTMPRLARSYFYCCEFRVWGNTRC